MPMLTLAACSSKNIVYSGVHHGKKLTVKNVREKSLFNDYFYQTLKLGSLPELEIKDITTNKGVPYSMDLYTNRPHYFSDTAEITYLNQVDTARNVNAILYLSPGKFSKNAFEQYAAFFNNGWHAIKDSIILDQGYRTLNIIGLVHGSDKDFELNFSGEHEGSQVILSVWTNGEIHYKFSGGIQSTNLSAKVQMPGKIILLKKEGGSLTPEILRAFKDAGGKNLYDYFVVKNEF